MSKVFLTVYIYFSHEYCVLCVYLCRESLDSGVCVEFVGRDAPGKTQQSTGKRNAIKNTPGLEKNPWNPLKNVCHGQTDALTNEKRL